MTSTNAGPRAATRRVFFATWPDAEAAAALTDLARRVAESAHGRAPVHERLHLTLAFIGDATEARVQELMTIGAEIAARTVPFTLRLDRLGFFRDAGIAWIGCNDVPEPLQATVEALQSSLAKAAFPVDPRPYRVHVSLARRCRHRPGDVAFVPLAWHAQAMTLHASTLTNAGPAYAGLASWTFGGAAQ